MPIIAGAEAFCPECGALLFPVRSPKGGGRRGLVIGGIAAIVVLAIIAAFSWSRLVPRPQATPVPLTAVARPTTAVQSVALRLCGSNLMGERLAPLLSKGFALHRTDVQPLVSADGTSTAFALLAKRTCDVGMSSRQILPSERSRLRFLGDMTSPQAEHVIGLDGITVIVNKSNRLSALSIPDIRRVFAGSAEDWSALRGAPGTIHLFVPTINTGTVDSFKMLVMGNAAFAPGLRKVRAVPDVAAAVARDKNGIGFVSLPYVNGAKPINVMFGTLAIPPDRMNLVRETYPLSRRLYLYTAARPSSAVKAFVDYAQSDEGQLNVDRAGFFGTTKGGKTHAVRVLPPDAPHEYVRLTRTADQSPFVFYFKIGSDALDNKALVDIGRLVQTMNDPANRDQQIILAGFADNTGDHDKNKILSEKRAESVERELTARHVKVKNAVGFGDAMPIRDNSTPEGREKNRRVEIFVTFKPAS